MASVPSIRRAVLADLPQIVEMGRRFLHSTPYAELIADNPERMEAMASMLITQEHGLLYVAADSRGELVGMIGMLVFDHHLSGERVAGEVFWWVDPHVRGTLGIRLLRNAEAWAAEQHVNLVQWVAPNEDVGRIYVRLGYAPVEVAYQRRLS